MHNGKKVLAVIPARGRNDGIKHMNMRELGGYPLVYHTIKTALNCDSIDRVFVSTEDKEIAQYVKKIGIGMPFLRNSSLSEKYVLMEEVIEEVIDYFESKKEKFDIALCLYPNAPFKSEKTITKFLNKIHNFDYVIPLYGHKSFYWEVDNGSVELLFNSERSTRDKTSTKYEELGGVYAYNISGGNWKDSSKNRKISYCELDFHESRMINSIYDLITYERLIKFPENLIEEILKSEL